MGVEKDPAKAAEWMERAIAAGNRDAMNRLGLYLIGFLEGMPKDKKAGVKLLKQAAEKGQVAATWVLGKCYMEGIGVWTNYKKARKYFIQAAGKGSEDAVVDLARLYHSGKGVKEDPDMAIRIVDKVANKKNKRAMEKFAKWIVDRLM